MKPWHSIALALLILAGCASVSSRAFVTSEGERFHFTIESKQSGVSIGHSGSPILPQKWTVGEILVTRKKASCRDGELTVRVPELYDSKQRVLVPATGTLAVDWTRRQIVVEVHLTAKDGLPPERLNGTFAF